MKYKQMAWLEPLGCDRKILHLKTDDGQWLPYTSFPALCKPDYVIPHGSKGYATMQHLLRLKWQLVPSEEAMTAPLIASV